MKKHYGIYLAAHSSNYEHVRALCGQFKRPVEVNSDRWTDDKNEVTCKKCKEIVNKISNKEDC